MAQSFEPPTLDFGSGHDLTVVRLSPTSGSMLMVHSLLGILSPSLCPSVQNSADWGTWLAQSEEHVTLDLGVLSPTLGLYLEIT